MCWPDVKISDVCQLAVDCVNKTAPVVDYETPYKMIRTTNVRGGFVDTNNCRYVTEETFKKWTRRSIPKKNDIILTREAPLGDVGRVMSDDVIFLGQRLFHYRANPKKINPGFLAYVLQSPLVQGRIKSKGFGATVQHVKVGVCEKLLIPLPPLPIQKKIGSILSTYDDLIENNRRRIQLLEEAARLLYKEWFVHLRFPGHEHTRITDGVPEGWNLKPLNELCYQYKETIEPKKVSFETPYIGLEHMPRRSITFSDWESSEKVTSTKFVFNEKDILFGKIRPYFHKVGFALCDGITSSDAVVIRARQTLLYHFVLAYISSDYFVDLASKTCREGSKMPRADWNYLEKQSVLVPSKEQLVEFSESHELIINQLKTLALLNIKLAQARDLLLPKLMNGEIEV